MSDKALVVIDMQNDYLWDKRKPMFSYDSKELTEKVNASIAEYKAKGWDIIYISQIFPNIITNKWFIGFSIRGTLGAELYSGLDLASDNYFEKKLPDTFSSKEFCEFVNKKRYKEMALCGLDECGCVGATAEGAVKRGIKTYMITDSIGRRFPEEKVNKMRATLRGLGVQYI
ncbi:MAG TPA: isochorismatase family cysteine hydrolase [Ruminococcus flavefaciens]|nr:isochorismatase family cysteine hydrolase [Ruminococcus flavefaciens]HQL99227.1 isochorismatase family cysteine hydrolase [Ruminococcus flavefaciens]